MVVGWVKLWLCDGGGLWWCVRGGLRWCNGVRWSELMCNAANTTVARGHMVVVVVVMVVVMVMVMILIASCTLLALS